MLTRIGPTLQSIPAARQSSALVCPRIGFNVGGGIDVVIDIDIDCLLTIIPSGQ